MNIKESLKNLTKFEWVLWMVSILSALITMIILGKDNLFSGIVSLVGVTGLIFVAKGDVLGPVIFLIFSILYAILSYTCKYYGEMLTYILLNTPVAIASIVSWVRHRHKKDEIGIRINSIKCKEIIFLIFLTCIVTIAFYFILEAFDTANLIVSTISITTSFVAIYLSTRRSKFYAVAYGCNDIVLMILWIMQSIDDVKYVSMVIASIIFLANDIYGFYNWSKMRKKQKQELKEGVVL